ncbi:hypothetical protein J4467_01935 [Candidatus Woesearchaeota archaeon]|nr:hypothetical protein [Candidatus Woesearchaeota archaeon]
MNPQHDDPILNREQLELEKIVLGLPALRDIGIEAESPTYSAFRLTVPYQQSLTDPNKVLPCANSYLPRSALYLPKTIIDHIEKTGKIILIEMLKEIGFGFIRILEITEINSRLFTENQKSADGKFKLNAYQVTGKLECKLK